MKSLEIGLRVGQNVSTDPPSLMIVLWKHSPRRVNNFFPESAEKPRRNQQDDHTSSRRPAPVTKYQREDKCVAWPKLCLRGVICRRGWGRSMTEPKHVGKTLHAHHRYKTRLKVKGISQTFLQIGTIFCDFLFSSLGHDTPSQIKGPTRKGKNSLWRIFPHLEGRQH